MAKTAPKKSARGKKASTTRGSKTVAKRAPRAKSVTKKVAPKPKRAAKRPPKGPSFSALKKAAKDMLPLIQAEADEAESQYHLTDKVVNASRKAGLYAMCTPKALGGSELPWVEAMEIAEMVAHADGSAGWCLMVAGVMGSNAGAFLPAAGAKKMFPRGADVTVAGQGVPNGKAWKVDGGYKIQGHWSYGSTIWHAEWIHSGCFLMEGDQMKMVDGHPVVVLCHHPRDTITLKGNWDVLGLRGSGSFDYTLKGGKELFVPDDTCFMFDNPPVQRGGIQYMGGLPVMTSWGHTSWALGVGRRVLDELAKLALVRVDAFGRMHDSASFKQKYAEAEAKYRAARALVYNSWTDLCENYAKNKPGTVEQVALIRLAMRHLHDVVSEIATFAHKAARGVAIRPSLLQRAYRDTHTGTQHILLADEIAQECGRVLMGATSKKAEWTVFGVAD